MYSVVLLMAMSTGGDAIDCHGGGGCRGGRGRHGCTGGSCYGGGCHGGGYGGCYGGGYGGCYGGGCYGGVSYGGGCSGGYIVPMGKTEEKKGEKIGPGKEKKEGETDAAATVIVTLPADAKLIVDGNATVSTSAVRTFVTPVLEAGKEFVYNFKAEVVRDGKTVTLVKTVDVAAGREVSVSFEEMGAAVASR
jgi:uncharacterized protein (TIGR03000 family)